MTPAEVRQEATSCLHSPEHLQVNQQLLLSITKLSINCRKVQLAAANALMILKKAHFRFTGIDLKSIQVPGVRLVRTDLAPKKSPIRNRGLCKFLK